MRFDKRLAAKVFSLMTASERKRIGTWGWRVELADRVAEITGKPDGREFHFFAHALERLAVGDTGRPS